MSEIVEMVDLNYKYNPKNYKFMITVEDLDTLKKTDYQADGLKIDELPAGYEQGELRAYDFKVETLEDGFLMARCKKVYEKPAIGVKPCFVASEMRIMELVKGIERQLDSGSPNHKLIKRWASEIVGQCDLIEADKEWGKK